MSASLPVPDMEERLSVEAQAKLRRRVIAHFCNKQIDVLEKVMFKLLPVELFLMAYDESPPFKEFMKRQNIVKAWLDRNDIRIVQQGTTQQIFKGRELIYTFGMKLAEK